MSGLYAIMLCHLLAICPPPNKPSDTSMDRGFATRYEEPSENLLHPAGPAEAERPTWTGP